MKMKSVEVEITGETPLLMHNIAGADLENKSRKTLKTYNDKEEAEKSAYWMKEGKKKVLCVPSRCLYGCLRTASGYFKVRGRSMRPVIAGSVRIEPENISLGTDKYEMDKQSVVVQRARIMRVRPKLENWKLLFKLVYNQDYITDPEILKNILEEAGVKVGLLDFRPANGGQYGIFTVTKFQPNGA